MMQAVHRHLFFIRIRLTALMLLFFSIAVFCEAKPRVLVFSKASGFRHASIPKGQAAIIKLGKEHGFDVDTTESTGHFNKKALKQYAAVIFLNTTGDVLNAEQQSSFEKYIRAGGGYVGVHAATDTEYEWSWYGGLVGAYFDGHPAQQEAILHVVDRSNASTLHLPATWQRKDEWYNFKNIKQDLHVLMTIDEKSYTGGKNGDVHPMAWYHHYDGGRAWYTALGHTDASYTEENFLKHLLGGIWYAMGRNNKR